MCPFWCAIFLLGLSSQAAAAANFTQVFEWNEWDYEWPSEAIKTQALKDGNYKTEKIHPLFMAVYGTRIFLTLSIWYGIQVTLVSLPTSSASSAPPKLTPFPSWDMNKVGDYYKIERASGLQVDSNGKLWVLDYGTTNSKIWTIDLNNNDHTEIIHRFPFHKLMHDIVLDETPNGTFAYISTANVFEKQYIFVFSLQKNESWTVDPQRMNYFSMALSPKKEPSQLFLGKYRNSSELYSIPVATLRDGTRTANPTLVGDWTAIHSYRMMMDKNGTLYTAFLDQNYIYSLNTSAHPFQVQRFYEVAGLTVNFWPFTFALDENGTFWMTVYDDERKPRYRLLNDAVKVKSSTPAEETATTEGQNSTPTQKLHQDRRFIIILVCSNVFALILLSLIIIWLILRQKRDNSPPANTNEAHQMTIFSDEELTKYHEFQDDVNLS